MSDLVPKPTQSSALSTELVAAAKKAAGFVAQGVPVNTQRAYATDWAVFTDWCRKHRVQPMPAQPQVVAAFIADQASTLKPSSIRRRLAAIAKMHSVQGHPSPCSAEPVPATLKGIEATLGVRQQGKAPATLDVIERLVATPVCRVDTLEGLRNRAMLLVGFAGAFRRSELTGILASDLTWSDQGVVVLVRRSKTDQRGEGKTKAIPFVDGPLCAAKALQAWLVASGCTVGAVFRGFTNSGTLRPTALSPDAVAVLVKAAAEAAGLDPSQFAGHSLRAGHVTQARASGVSDAVTMSTTGHKRLEMLDVYDRRNNVFDKTSAGDVLRRNK